MQIDTVDCCDRVFVHRVQASVLTTEPQHIPTYAPYESELRFEQSVGGGATDLISEGAGVLVVLSRCALPLVTLRAC